MTLGPIPVAFGLLVVTAGAFDFVWQRIPNWIVVTLVVLFFVQALRHVYEVWWLGQLGASVGCLVVGMGLYAAGQLGAGDAKFLAGVALWSGIHSLLPLMLFVSLSGLVLLVALLGGRRLVSLFGKASARLPKSLLPGQGVPFGVAITLGSLATMAGFPSWLWRI